METDILLPKNHYNNLIFLGKGEYGTVYKAYDTKSNNYVCIKIIPKEKIDYDFYSNEINILKTIKTKYNINYIDDFSDNLNYYLVTDLCDSTLDEELKKENGFSVLKIKKILIQLNEVFKFMHKNNIIYFDLHTENIFINYTNNLKTDFDIKLGDFGLARFKGETNTKLKLIFPLEEIHQLNLITIGTLIYQLYYNDNIFKGKDDYETEDNLENLRINKLTGNKDLDYLIKNLIKKPEDKNRMSWDEYLNYEFFKN